MSERRARTRLLIELGGLVARSGLEEAIATHEAEARAVILGAMLALAENLHAPANAAMQDRLAAWRERGRQALRDADPSSRSDPDAFA